MDDTKNTGTEITTEEFAAAVSPRDLRGRINLRIESWLQQEIEQIADDSRFPLHSPSEVVRFCLRDGLMRLRAWNQSPTMLGQLKSAHALMMRDKMQCEAIELLTRLDERVEWYIANGFYDEVLTVAGEVFTHFNISGLSNDFWAKYMRDEIDKRMLVWQERIDTLRKA